MMFSQTICALFVAAMVFSNAAVDASTQVAQQDSTRRPGDGGRDATKNVGEIVSTAAKIPDGASTIVGGVGQTVAGEQKGTTTISNGAGEIITGAALTIDSVGITIAGLGHVVIDLGEAVGTQRWETVTPSVRRNLRA
ncbi:hypothetical protein PHYBOEH_009442 [Phytophthora boehmeriae]|uniref:Uncharacterized protein n=1 Tax=Phytophthora boehmeriae TaxID=109152 RepID=A0A8T1VW27_9STRA|nr:hypothetical protein PHYBOEH_009442 [Phytophthora boehmeriae]